MLEIERLGEPIGKQDQYAAAYGGINLIEFERHGGVTVQPLLLSPATLAELEANLMLFYTGTPRDARTVLSQQVKSIEDDEATVVRMQQMVDLAYEMRDHLLSGELDTFGLALHRGWEIKRGLSAAISTSAIDRHYARARAAAASCCSIVLSRRRRACARRSIDCKASNSVSTGPARASRLRNNPGS
jgi:D-glycero-alpha-D-manno-heptose-7-phosphate kinase